MTTPLAVAASASRDVAIQTPPLLDTAPNLEIVGATVRGARGAVFGPLDATSSAPITVVHGNRGSGRTSLLLSAAGRMRIDRGTVKVRGIDAREHAAQVRRLTGIAGFDAIDLLESGATVGESIRERLTWISPWYRRVPKFDDDAVCAILGPVFGPIAPPASGSLIRDLTEAQEMLLRIALAMLESPRIVLVDDLDDVKDPSERAAVADRLTALAQAGTFFVVGSADERDLNLFTPEHRALITLGR